ncbi:MAG: hypothetical protein ACQR33_05580 [Candidatus Saccharibacteria bacterium]
MATQPPVANPSTPDQYNFWPPKSKWHLCFTIVFAIAWFVPYDFVMNALVGRAEHNMQAACMNVDPQRCLRASSFMSIGLIVTLSVLGTLLLLIIFSGFILARFEDHNKDVLVLRSDQQHSEQQLRVHQAANGMKTTIRNQQKLMLAGAVLLAFIAYLIYNS